MPRVNRAFRCADRAGGIISRSEDDYIGSRKVFEIIQILEPARCPFVLLQVFESNHGNRYAVDFSNRSFGVALVKFQSGNVGENIDLKRRVANAKDLLLAQE